MLGRQAEEKILKGLASKLVCDFKYFFTFGYGSIKERDRSKKIGSIEIYNFRDAVICGETVVWLQTDSNPLISKGTEEETSRHTMKTLVLEYLCY